MKGGVKVMAKTTSIRNLSKETADRLVTAINKVPGNILNYIDATNLITIVREYQELSQR